MKKDFLLHRTEDPKIESAERAAWLGFNRKDITLPYLESLVGNEVIDTEGEEVGRLHCVWRDEAQQAGFLGIKTGWLGLGSIHVVPAEFAEFNQYSSRIRVPFTKDLVKNAPSYEEDDELDTVKRRDIFDYFNTHQGGRSEPIEEQPESKLPPDRQV